MDTDRIRLHMNYGKAEEKAIITIDDDYIVPDVKPDIAKKIKEQGEVFIENVRAMEGRAGISGKFLYRLLYSTDRNCECMEGIIDFEETVAMDITSQDIVKCRGCLEDITVTIINSRKISVKAIIVLEVCAEAVTDFEVIERARIEKLQSINKKIDMKQLECSKKDIFRIREAVNLPSDRKNIGRIIWKELEIRNTDIRAAEGELSIKGEMSVFCIYTPETNEDEFLYYDNVVGFTGRLPVTDCTSDMLPDICITTSQKSLTARPDANGEMRILDAEVILDFDIKCYMEREYNVLADVYSPAFELTPKLRDTEYESFIASKKVVCKTDERVKQPVEGISQIVNADGRISIEDIAADETGVNIEGAISAGILYMKDDEQDKLGYIRYEIPFSQHTEVSEITADSVIRGKSGGLRISAAMSGGEFDIKCSAELDLMVVEKKHEKLITDIEVNEPDYEKIKRLPAMTGCIIKDGDTLWDIAKRYCTTMDSIIEINKLQDTNLKAGMKLLVVKST